MRLKAGRYLSLSFFTFFFFSAAWAVPAARGGNGAHSSSTKLNLAQIVAGIRAHDRAQQAKLTHYQALRVYSVEYHGLGSLSAGMKVEVTYDAANGKHFRIISQSGSVLLRRTVLSRALKSEEEASKERGSTALVPANYKFRLVGSDTVGGRETYVLDVTPVKPQKFLYKGRIWVNATDFGLVKIQASPAINPSFWISRTSILLTDEETHGFWLPELMRSRTHVRFGGSALMTIDYGQYQIQSTPTGY